jgi:hypothetical protein
MYKSETKPELNNEITEALYLCKKEKFHKVDPLICNGLDLHPVAKELWQHAVVRINTRSNLLPFLLTHKIHDLPLIKDAINKAVLTNNMAVFKKLESFGFTLTKEEKTNLLVPIAKKGYHKFVKLFLDTTKPDKETINSVLNYAASHGQQIILEKIIQNYEITPNYSTLFEESVKFDRRNILFYLKKNHPEQFNEHLSFIISTATNHFKSELIMEIITSTEDKSVFLKPNNLSLICINADPVIKTLLNNINPTIEILDNIINKTKKRKKLQQDLKTHKEVLSLMAITENERQKPRIKV